MAFWGVEVKPGKPFTHTADDVRGRLHISQATLGIGTAPEKSVVQCNVGNKSPVFLCSLFPEKTESCQLNLEFEEADEVVFSVIGPRSVHLTGYFLGTSGRHYNINDESESYGEDIADTETERSTGHTDEDGYEDSFINDSDPEVFPTSPVSDDRASEMEMLDRRKPKNAKGSHKRLRKKYQLSESDDDIDAQNQTLANGSASMEALDSDSEDMLPISSVCKVDTNSSENFEAKEKDVWKSGETNTAAETEVEKNAEKISCQNRNGESKDEGNCITMSEAKSNAVLNGEPKRSSLGDSVLPSVEISPESDAKPKKKRKVHSEKRKHLVNDGNDCSNVLQEDKALINDVEADKVVQNFPAQSEENQKTSNHIEGVNLSPDSLLPSTEVGSEKHAKPKKRKRKERAEEKDDTILEKDINALKAEVRHDSMGEDLPERIEQNEKQDNDKILDNDLNQSVAELQPEEKKKKKKKKRTNDEKDMNMEKPILSKDIKNGSAMDTENSSAEGQLSQVSTLPNGLVIQELETGKPNGKVAASGKKISVCYTGRLKENGQVFVTNIGTSPLKFHLGRNEVIEGLNVGLEGMQVGEKRRLIVPPSMGYGSEGDDGKNIPPNSWLEYDVELVKVHR
ncbi:Peptidylprolyl isomerase [Melia azedarach]|uniref:Peptidylprolyl isomerase n=1 Tax=Melia azedarach TaxID=155640 RepID=A0ACC1Y5R7_MELAZ|nr:Peptidylprolyl isomerase [Melia azedarach]